MKKILYFDASSGVSGDMFVGALIDAGADIEIIRNHIDSLGLDGFSIRARKVSKSGLMGTKFDVIDPETGRDVDEPEDNHHGHNHGHDHNGHGHDHGHGQHLQNHGHEHGDHPKNTPKKHHRSLWDIGSIICKSGLPQPVIDDAIAVFKLIAIAESKVHGTTLEEVHFHEVGALDCIVDIVSAASAFHQLNVDEAWCSPIHVGSGTVRCAHGLLPVPAPATMELLHEVPIYSTEVKGELATPTGAALVRHFCKGFAPMPQMIVEKVGYGAGSKDFGIPNLFRATIGKIDESIVPQTTP